MCEFPWFAGCKEWLTGCRVRKAGSTKIKIFCWEESKGKSCPRKEGRKRKRTEVKGEKKKEGSQRKEEEEGSKEEC